MYVRSSTRKSDKQRPEGRPRREPLNYNIRAKVSRFARFVHRLLPQRPGGGRHAVPDANPRSAYGENVAKIYNQRPWCGGWPEEASTLAVAWRRIRPPGRAGARSAACAVGGTELRLPAGTRQHPQPG